MSLRFLIILVFIGTLFEPPGMRAAAAPGPTDPIGDRMWGLTNVWNVHITFTREAWQQLGGAQGPGNKNRNPGLLDILMNNGGNFQGSSHVDYPWSTATIDWAGNVVSNVATRYKGVSSFVRAPNALKRPFKLDFNKDAKGRRFGGVSELCLNNNVNDATQMREVLAYDLFRRADLPASRTAFARVYLSVPGVVKKQHLGLFTVIEAVDDDYLDRYFQNHKGILVKPSMMNGLAYHGNRWTSYQGQYHPKNDATPAEQKRFMDFVKFAAENDDDDFAKGIGEYLDPIPFLRFVALNAILANVDSFIGNGHNYYLYQNTKTGKSTFIPWDLNEAFGMHPVSGPSGQQMRTSVLRPNADSNPLVEKFLANPALNKQYRAQLQWALTNLFDPKRLAQDIDRIAAVTQPIVFAESKRAKADFERTVLGTLDRQSGDTSQPRHDPEIGPSYNPRGFPDAIEIDNLPLKDWIKGRVLHVQGQLEGKTKGRSPRARLF